MSRISPALMSSTSPRAIQKGQPGSNGYWRRDQFNRPGTYTWTAKKTGKIKIQAIGAGCGGRGQGGNGPAGGYGEKTLDVVAGQTLTLVLGIGSSGTASNGETPAQGGTTSISGTPVGGTPLVLVGATINAAGNGTGPWDVTYPGGGSGNQGTGGSSSGSPFGPGFISTGRGGAGWGGGSNGDGGASSHAPVTDNSGSGAVGLTTTSPSQTANTSSLVQISSSNIRDFWDLADVDSAGGSRIYIDSQGSNFFGMDGGPGAGGACGLQTQGSSALGGGNGATTGNNSMKAAGFGGGGVASQNAGYAGGKGGNAIIFIFWDEVAA